ncbi:hypothetical protein ACFOY4_24325 [Actinomadura syzygii]|uniref:Uncharacterized protein n=1 Tax=Actinomadura syzygii TaxID=1427538 RepID=A0A5D0UKW8_9ACTN|nr:hypothetical protein [Actinomadura syzygii]TYC18446.1 hypothetical protein FXF65_01400 [Actinomadura syzygii]
MDDKQDPMDPAEAGLRLEYDVYHGDGGRGGGIEGAQRRFASAKRVASHLPDSGSDQVSDAELGDEAFARSVYRRAEVVVRRSNAVITVTLTTPKSTQADSLAAAQRIAQTAVAELSLDA